jgi:hypothetical protein
MQMTPFMMKKFWGNYQDIIKTLMGHEHHLRQCSIVNKEKQNTRGFEIMTNSNQSDPTVIQIHVIRSCFSAQKLFQKYGLYDD